jgi:hypothetical protein
MQTGTDWLEVGTDTAFANTETAHSLPGHIYTIDLKQRMSGYMTMSFIMVPTKMIIAADANYDYGAPGLDIGIAMQSFVHNPTIIPYHSASSPGVNASQGFPQPMVVPDMIYHQQSGIVGTTLAATDDYYDQDPKMMSIITKPLDGRYVNVYFWAANRYGSVKYKIMEIVIWGAPSTYDGLNGFGGSVEDY